MNFPNISFDQSAGGPTLHIGKRTFIHTIFEWGHLVGHWNWIDFHVIDLSFESDNFLPGFEAQAIILGCGLRFRYNSPAGDEQVERWIAESDRLAETEDAKAAK